MKKKRFLLVAAAAALLAAGAVACGKDSDEDTENNNGGGSTTVSWVDLGLPSGLLWADRNLGANAPEEYGDYYAWGDTAPKSEYRWSNYRYCTADSDGYLQTLTKYNTSSTYGTTDTLATLQAMDDAATQALGSGARTPTYTEWEELMSNTTAEWTTVNGVNGRRFTAANGASLFLPAAGFRRDGELLDAAEGGRCWSATLLESYPYDARNFDFGEGGQSVESDHRYYGQSVRPVRSAR